MIYKCLWLQCHTHPSESIRYRKKKSLNMNSFKPFSTWVLQTTLLEQTFTLLDTTNFDHLLKNNENDVLSSWLFKHCLPKMWCQCETPWDLFVLVCHTKTEEFCDHQPHVQLVGCTSWMQFLVQHFSPAFHTIFGHTMTCLKWTITIYNLVSEMIASITTEWNMLQFYL